MSHEIILKRIEEDDPKETSIQITRGKVLCTESMTRLSNGLNQNSVITSFSIRNNKIEDTGTTILAMSLFNKCGTSSTCIQELTLHGCGIGDMGARCLANMLTSNSTITTLNLTKNFIGPVGAACLANALMVNSSLTVLNINRNYIGSQGAQSFAKLLEGKSEIIGLDLGHNQIGSEGIMALSNSLVKNSSLKMLGLNGNRNIEENAFTALMDALYAIDSISELNLSNIGNVRSSIYFSKAIDGKSDLMNLDLSRNSICSKGIQQVADSLKGNNTIQSLNLSDNQIGAHDAEVLANALIHNTSITSITLSNNNLGPRGARSLAKFLKGKPIIELLLANNSVGSDGVEALAESLSENTILKFLDLDNNNIGSKGIKFLANALINKSQIERLRLTYNCIGEKGILVLCNSLVDKSKIWELWLGRNIIGDHGAKTIATVLGNKKIISFKIEDNCITDEGITAIAGRLSGNSTIQELDLSNNRIGSAGFKNLSNRLTKAPITDFRISGNLGEYGGLDIFFKKILQEKPIAKLHLAGINLESVEQLSDLLRINHSITELNLSDNDLSSSEMVDLFHSIEANTSLESFILDGTILRSESATKLSKALKNKKYLRHLQLNNNNLQSNDFRNICRAIMDKPLVSLEISNNGIGDDEIEFISDIISKNWRSIEVVKLDHNNISAHGLSELTNSMKSSVSIQELHLNGNKVDLCTSSRLSDSLINSNTNVTKVFLCNNNIGQIGALLLSEWITNKHHLLSGIWLGDCKIGDAGAKILSDAIAHPTNIQSLVLCGNQIGPVGIQSLTKILANCAKLTELDLSKNDLGREGARLLSASLKDSNSAITSLNLSTTNIGTDGAESIAAALLNKDMLRILKLDNNGIEDRGIQALSRAIINMPITELYLSNNKCGDDGAISLSDMLTNNVIISELYLQENPIGDQGTQVLCSTLINNKFIQKLEINGVREMCRGIVKRNSRRGLLPPEELFLTTFQFREQKQANQRLRMRLRQMEQTEREIRQLREELLESQQVINKLQSDLLEMQTTRQQYQLQATSVKYMEQIISGCINELGLSMTVGSESKTILSYPVKENEYLELERKETEILGMMKQLLNQEIYQEDYDGQAEKMKYLSKELNENREQQLEYLRTLERRLQALHDTRTTPSPLLSKVVLLKCFLEDHENDEVSHLLSEVQKRSSVLCGYTILHKELLQKVSQMRSMTNKLCQINLDTKLLDFQIETGQQHMSAMQLEQQYRRLEELKAEQSLIQKELKDLDSEVYEVSQGNDMVDMTLRVIQERKYREQELSQKKRRRSDHFGDEYEKNSKRHCEIYEEVPVNQVADGLNRFRSWLRDQMHLLVDRKYAHDYVFLKAFETNMNLVSLKGEGNGLSRVLKLIPWSPQSEIRIRHEIRVLNHLVHPHIVRLHSVFIDEEDIYLELEHCEEGNLKQWTQSKKRSFFEIRRSLRQMIQGIGYIHARGIIHRDLRSENVLIDRNGVIKLSGFETSSDTKFEFQLDCNDTPEPTTSPYTAPEVIHGKQTSEFSDMWSAGIIIGEMLFPKWEPHSNEVGDIIMPNTDADDHYNDFGMSKEQQRIAVNLMKSLLVKNISNNERRLSAAEVLNHEFFTMEALEMEKREQRILAQSDKLLWFQSFMRHYRNGIKKELSGVIKFHGINRKNVVPEVVDALTKQLKELEDLFLSTAVTFSGESGVDDGGLSHDLFTQFFAQLFEAKHGLFVAVDDDECPHLFVPSDESPNSSSHPLRTESTFDIIGRVLMKCLIDEKPMVLPFHPMVFSALLYREDPSIYGGSNPNNVVRTEWWLREAERTGCGGLASRMRQMMHMVQSGQCRLQDLLGDESIIDVHQYILETLRKKLISGEQGNRYHYLNAMRRGFLQSLPKDENFSTSYVMKLSRDELQLLLCGPQHLDAEIIISQMICSSEILKDFMARLLRSMGNQQLRHFLLWVTALGALPYNGKLPKKISIRSSNRFMSHTCFNELEIDRAFLPTTTDGSSIKDSDYERFKDKMLHMMNLAHGSTMEE